MVKTMYVVTSGEYSDLRIEGVFDSLAKAKTLTSGDDILQFPLNGVVDDDGRKLYEVTLFESGGVAVVTFANNDPNDPVDSFRVREYGNSQAVIFTLKAKTSRAAIKIARERLMQVKAMPHFYPDWDKRAVCANWSRCPEYGLYDYTTGKLILSNGYKLYEKV